MYKYIFEEVGKEKGLGNNQFKQLHGEGLPDFSSILQKQACKALQRKTYVNKHVKWKRDQS